MQKKYLRTAVWASISLIAVLIWLFRNYPDNKFIATLAAITVPIAFLVFAASGIALNIRSKTDKKDPILAKAPPLPTFSTVLRKALLYVVVPGVIITTVLFVVLFVVGWRPPTY
jgi:xanthine/uracil/vitamin C permease (AzgA family)